ncbi:hypothetical protein AB6A40_005283 [Gnathostoma spinigerum]|uniref:Uncharacterized protein n=1 Tax=Gnathostoma spinigerum TaxID=75299 RepID=A0ABD6EMM8_9BILA
MEIMFITRERRQDRYKLIYVKNNNQRQLTFLSPYSPQQNCVLHAALSDNQKAPALDTIEIRYYGVWKMIVFLNAFSYATEFTSFKEIDEAGLDNVSCTFTTLFEAIPKKMIITSSMSQFNRTFLWDYLFYVDMGKKPWLKPEMYLEETS